MKNDASSIELPWINPIGGLGDSLMLSSVLKMVVDNNPSHRFHLIRRTNYLSILRGHPAIEKIGFPPPDAEIINTDYWNQEGFESNSMRAFQVLAAMFKLSTPVEENFYLPGHYAEDSLLHGFIPWKKRNVIIAPSSVSPRKEMSPFIWHALVEELREAGTLVIQVGNINDLHIKNTYSLLGLTSCRQLISLIKMCDMVISVDNFIMHAAHMVGKPAVILWGPTSHTVYGYDDQINMQAPTCEQRADCIGPRKGSIYHSPCPRDKHCIDTFTSHEIYMAVQQVIHSTE
jgi:ADP-heptose:LPS heptosyltransferase